LDGIARVSQDLSEALTNSGFVVSDKYRLCHRPVSSPSMSCATTSESLLALPALPDRDAERQHGDGGMAHHTLGNASHEEARDATSPRGSHADAVHPRPS